MTSRRIIIRNVSEITCIRNEKSKFMFSDLLHENCVVCELIKKLLNPDTEHITT
jgi:hypothetical protein